MAALAVGGEHQDPKVGWFWWQSDVTRPDELGLWEQPNNNQPTLGAQAYTQFCSKWTRKE